MATLIITSYQIPVTELQDFGNVVLQLEFEGTDGDTFTTDVSNFDSAIAFNSPSAIDDSQAKIGNTSVFHGAGTSNLRLPSSQNIAAISQWGVNTDMTMEMWTRFNGDPGGAGDKAFLSTYHTPQNDSFLWRHYNGDMQFILGDGAGGGVSDAFAWDPDGDTWYHIAVCLKRGVTDIMYFWVDGQSIGQSTLFDGATNVNGNTYFGVEIGSYWNQQGGNHGGWMDSIRMVNGEALYTSPFTPPTNPHLVPPPPVLALTGHDFSTDNYELTNPSVTQTDKTIVSLWFKWDYRIGDQGDLFNFMIHNSGGRFYVDFSPAGQIQIKTYNAAVAVIQLVASSVTPAWHTDDAWHHVLYSRDGTTAHLYIDDVEDKFLHSPNTAGNASNNSANHWYHGMAFNNTFGFKGCVSNVYENHQEYLDFSIEANRRKFITALGEPVDAGNDGSGPTGLIPEVWVANGLPTTNNGTTNPYSLVSGSGAVPCDSHPISVLSTAGAVLTETIGPATVSVIGSGTGQIDFGAQFGFADFDNPGTDTGGNNYIILNDTTGAGVFVAPGAFTFEAWLKFDSFNTDSFVVIAQSPGAYPTTDQFFIQVNRSNGTVGVVNETTELCRASNQITLTGTWYHVAVTRDDANQCRVWINGLQGSTSNNVSGVVGVDDGGGDSRMFLMGGPIAMDNSDVDGQFNGFRWINGKALYSGAGSITVPTVAPF